MDPAPAPKTNSPVAFDLYLKARFLSEQFSPADFEKAERFYREALQVDGRYAQARQGLPELLVKMNILGIRSPATTVEEAMRQLELAVELDPSMSAAYATRGSLLARHFYQWASAERDFRKALTLDPHNAMAHNLLVQDVVAPQGRFFEAFSEQKLARDLDSVSELVAMGYPFLLILARRNAEALDLIQAGLRRRPGDPGWMGINANALVAVGKFSAALEQYQGLQQMTPSPQISGFMGAIEAKMGNLAAARIRFQQLDEMSRTVYMTPLSYALIETELGMLDHAFRHLEQGRQNRESALIFSKIGRHMNPLRRDPRYQNALIDAAGNGQHTGFAKQRIQLRFESNADVLSGEMKFSFHEVDGNMMFESRGSYQLERMKWNSLTERPSIP